MNFAIRVGGIMVAFALKNFQNGCLRSGFSRKANTRDRNRSVGALLGTNYITRLCLMSSLLTPEKEIMKTFIDAQSQQELPATEKPSGKLRVNQKWSLGWIVHLIFVVHFQFAVINFAVASDRYKQIRSTLDNLEKNFKKQLESGCERLLSEIDSARTQAMKAGQLDLWQSLNLEYSGFRDARILPSTISPVVFRKSATMLLEAMLLQYQTNIANELKSKNFESAQRLEQEMGEFETKFERDFPKTRVHRTKWTHATGKFEKTNNREWIEHTPNTRFTFQEVDRNPAEIILFDQARTVTLILKDEQCYLREKSGKRKLLFNGKFDN